VQGGKDRRAPASWMVEGPNTLSQRARSWADRTGRSTVEERRVGIVRPHRRLLILPAAVLGAAVVVLPAVAGSETAPTIEAVNSTGYYSEQIHRWSPPQATVAAGGVVTLSNNTAVEHGVKWVGGPEQPSCTGSIPVGTTAETKGANWTGTCAFQKPGVYTFYCTVHGSEMTGVITVNANGPGTTQPPSSGGGAETTGTSTVSETGAGKTPGSSQAPGSPLTGGAAAAVRLPRSQRGRSVHGSVSVSRNGAGGRLEVVLLAKGAALAKPGGSARAQVGRLVRTSLGAGTVPFVVALDARARRVLHDRRRLALTVRIVLTPSHGPAVTIVRSVVLHA
jgi:plastocyanin